MSSVSANNRLLSFRYATARGELVSLTGDCIAVLGAAQEILTNKGDLFLRHIHPEDRFAAANALEASLVGAVPYHQVYRWLRPDNQECRWLACRAENELNGEEDLLSGSIIDITHEVRIVTEQHSWLWPICTTLCTEGTELYLLDSDLRVHELFRGDSNTAFKFGDANFATTELQPGKPFLPCFMDNELRAKFSVLLSDILDEKHPTDTQWIKEGNRQYELRVIRVIGPGSLPGVLITVKDRTNYVALRREHKLLQTMHEESAKFQETSKGLIKLLASLRGHASALQLHSHESLSKRIGVQLEELVEKAHEFERQLYQRLENIK